MKNKLLLLFLSAGWILLILFLVSGYYFQRFSGEPAPAFLSPIAWEDHMLNFRGAIQCSLTSGELMERKALLKKEVFSKIARKEETDQAMVYYFKDDPDLLSLLFELVEKEKACCPFFKFDVSVLAFEKGMALQISGSEEAMDFLKEVDESD